MTEFLEEKLMDLFYEFKERINDKPSLCGLKNISFINNIPNYEDEDIQYFYLLRYMMGYFVEYVNIYRAILKENFLNEVNIISFGCGCGVDLWSAIHVFKENKKSRSYLNHYDGYDKVEWKYFNSEERWKLEEENKVFLSYIIENISEINLIRPEANVFIFPKSLSDFNDGEFEHMKKLIKKTNFKEERIIIIGAMTEKYQMQMGVNKYDKVCQKERLDNIVSLFQEKDYKIIKRMDKYDVTQNSDKNIFSVVKGLYYPSEIIEFLVELNMQCKIRKKQGYYCQEDCENILSRYPILRMTQFNDEIIFLEKRGKN